jgi:pyruvate dehydrogenase E1 component alpha subunit
VSGSQVKRAQGFDMPAREVNGHDFFEVYEASGEAIEKARGGHGPSLLHVRLNRYYGHFEGDAQTYRIPGEVDRVRQSADAIDGFRQRVVEASLLKAEELDAADAQIKTGVERAVLAAKKSPMPTEADLMTDIYVRY